MPSIHAETPVKSTIAKIAAGAVGLLGFGLMVGQAVSNYTNTMEARFSKIDARLSSIDTFMRNEAVTQSQAERYANAFRWDNRNINLSVPPPSDFVDRVKPKPSDS